MKNTVGAFDWLLFRVLLSAPRKFQPSTRASGIGAFKESDGAMLSAGPVRHGAMLSAGPVVVVDHRTRLTRHSIKCAKANKVASSFHLF